MELHRPMRRNLNNGYSAALEKLHNSPKNSCIIRKTGSYGTTALLILTFLAAGGILINRGRVCLEKYVIKSNNNCFHSSYEDPFLVPLL